MTGSDSKTYRFYGWKTADIKDEKGLTPADYYDLLKEIWAADTCAPRLRAGWNPDNRTLGQCSITAFLLQDIYGGKVYGIKRGDGNYHCFNDVNGCVFDLTSEQFGDEKLDYSDCEEQFREVHFQKEEKRLRYELLKMRLQKESVEYNWTDGNNGDFRRFYKKTEEYYSKIAGGISNRSGFIPYNLSESIADVLIAYSNGLAIGCAGLKAYSDTDVEIKRVWVEPDWRGRGIATKLMERIEEKAGLMGYKRAILQTRPVMSDAVGLYKKRGYVLIDNYPPYDRLEGAICMALDLQSPL